jgi:serine/threonine-protein kinase
VNLTVAKEPAPVDVPDVSGQTEEDATRALEDAGFKVKTTDGTADTPEQDGTVVDQQPQPGEQAKKGSTVTITIGKFEPTPPDMTPTPSPTTTTVP